MRFVITTSPGRPGVRLSLRGQWGNLNHVDVESATETARKLAGGRAFTIDCEKGRR